MTPNISTPHLPDGVHVRSHGYAVIYQGKIVKTPAGVECVLPNLSLADAIAAEWKAQTSKINPLKMPLTQLAFTAIDIVERERSKIIDRVIAYVNSELLCHRADSPPELVKQQQEIWQPVLDWLCAHFDVILNTGSGVMPINQPPETIVKLRYVIESHNIFSLTGLSQIVDVSGSLALGLALAERHMTADQIFLAAELDTNFQIQKWGEDPVIVKRRENLTYDLMIGQRWFDLLDRTRLH
jgi:chaperone required for assembly of F1-ATPase